MVVAILKKSQRLINHNITNYLTNSIGLQKYISDVESTINFIKSKKRSKKDVKISFDEYQPWYHSIEFINEHLNADLKDWPKAHPILEDQYNLLDCLLVGTVLNTFINNSHVVKIACMAQLVNVIPAISTVKNGISWIRLDAVGFIWKEKNTNCMHRNQAHLLVKILRLQQNLIKFDFISQFQGQLTSYNPYTIK